MNDAERTILTNILGHLDLAAQHQQAAFTQVHMAEDKLKRLLGPNAATTAAVVNQPPKAGSELPKPTPPK